MRTELKLEDFMRALSALDKELTAINSKISIKAIGGFALIWHSVRGTGYTADIDSVTADYPTKVVAAIEKVAKELDLPDDWVNNYNVLENDVEAVEMMIDPFWVKAKTELKNISLWVADLETLIRCKLLAAEDDADTKRAQDFTDLCDLFKSVRCFSVASASAYCENVLDVNLRVEYPRNYARLRTVDWRTKATINDEKGNET